MYKECADEIAAAGLAVVLQFGETQWWYFPNASGMGFYDDDTKAAFQARYSRPLHRFDYDVWQKNARLMRQTLEFPLKLGRPTSECMYLAGIYGPPDPPMREAYGMWRNRGLYSFCFWAFGQFCLNSRPVPLEVAVQSASTLDSYHRPRAARSPEAPIAVAYAPEPGSRMNTCRFNARRANA